MVCAVGQNRTFVICPHVYVNEGHLDECVCVCVSVYLHSWMSVPPQQG